MRASNFAAMVGLGALCVGFGVGWIARGATSKGAPTDDISTDDPPRKPKASASTAAAKKDSSPPLWPKPSAALPTCDAPPAAAFAWPGTIAPYGDMIALDDTHFILDRAYVDKVIENQAELMKTARIVPDVVDGSVDGIRVYAVRPGTFLFRMGVRNGDVLHCMSGFSLSTPEQALEAYSHLRGAKALDLALRRVGDWVTLQYRITDAPRPSTSASASTNTDVLANPF